MGVTIKKVPKAEFMHMGNVITTYKAAEPFTPKKIKIVGDYGKLTPEQMNPFVDDLIASSKKPSFFQKITAPNVLAATVTVMGIDVSTSTGIVVLGYDQGHKAWRSLADYEINLHSLPKKVGMIERVNRVWELQEKIIKALNTYQPSVVAVEGYAFGHVQAQVTMVELGCAVRLAMMMFRLTHMIRLLEVAPSSLKKFVLGKGVGKKEQVMMQTFKRWGYEAQTNNLADAYVLAQIAAANTGTYGVLSKSQQEVLKVVS